jgi:FKBP-type peptidyl-prolyl cis-trans isomerase FklB
VNNSCKIQSHKIITFAQKKSMTEEIKAVSYCVGMSVAGSLMQQDLEGISPDVLAQAITDVFAGKTTEYSPEMANTIIEEYLKKTGEAKFSLNKEAGEHFLSENKNKEGVHTTTSGLQYEIIEEGQGAKPAATDTVSVHYHGTLIDGTIFDSSVHRGQPATFGVHQVIPGWTEALQLMSTGAKYRLYIPQELAYGAHPHPGGPIKPYSALIFDVELLEIN